MRARFTWFSISERSGVLSSIDSGCDLPPLVNDHSQRAAVLLLVLASVRTTMCICRFSHIPDSLCMASLKSLLRLAIIPAFKEPAEVPVTTGNGDALPVGSNSSTAFNTPT